MDKINYEEDTLIEPSALDLEWLKQADLMRKYAKHSAEMDKLVDEKKEKLDVEQARIEMDIRSNPEKYGISKLTEGAIQSTMLLQPELQKIRQEFIDAKYESRIAIAAVRAIDQRKTALENLVRLLGVSYFAGPMTPRDLTKEALMEKERKEQNRNVRIQRKKKIKE